MGGLLDFSPKTNYTLVRLFDHKKEMVKGKNTCLKIGRVGHVAQWKNKDCLSGRNVVLDRSALSSLPKGNWGEV